MITFFFKRRSGRNKARVAAMASTKPDDLSRLFPPGQRSIHMDDLRIADLATTHTGQQMLCSLIGDEGNGLDETSLQNVEEALLRQQVVEQVCINGVVRRLNMILINQQLKMDQGKNASTERAEERILLRAHPDQVSDVFSRQFALGSDNPNSELLALLSELEIHSSCDDLARSVRMMESAAHPLAAAFDKQFRKLCKA